MVKKPKDPFKNHHPTTPPPSKLMAGSPDQLHGGSMPRNRGAAAMTPASLPNYMKATSSSDAKAGRLRPEPASASPAGSRGSNPKRRAVRVTRGRVLFPKVSIVGRATCSSTMKECKFPDALDLAPGATEAEGPAALRVCPYTYCSLNGHRHAPAVPLRSFLASRRRLIKTQQSMKLKGVSAFRKSYKEDKTDDGGRGVKIAPLVEEEVGDFFVEIYAGPRVELAGGERVSSDMSCSDLSVEEMDAMVRRLEYVMFDRRCGDGEEKTKALGGRGEGKLEESFDACRESTSECSDDMVSGDLVELSGVRYQGYEYDSFDDDEEEEKGAQNIYEEEHRAREEMNLLGAVCAAMEISEEQEGTHEVNTLDRLVDGCKDEISEEQETSEEENIVDVACGVKDTGEEAATACRVEVFEEKESRDEENSVHAGCIEEASAGQESKEERLSDGVCKVDIPEQQEAKGKENIPDEGHKETTVDEKGEDEENIVSTACKSDDTKEQNVKDEEYTMDVGSEMEISEETIPDIGCKEDFSEEVTSNAVSEGVVSEVACSNAISFFDNEIHEQQIEGGDVFEQHDNKTNNVSEQDNSTGDGSNNSQKDSEITTCKLEDASEEYAISQENGQDNTEEDRDDACDELEITTCKLQGAFEESGSAQETNQDANTEEVSEGAQKELEITACKLDDASEESGIAQESNHDDKTTDASDDAQKELEITTCKSENVCEESGIAQESNQYEKTEDASGAPKELEITTCKSENVCEESVIAQETNRDDKTADACDDAQKELKITTCKPEVVCEESGIAQEINQDYSAEDISDGAQMEITTGKSDDASDESGSPQETTQDDNTADVSDGAQKELKISTCKLEDPCEEHGMAEETNDFSSNLQVQEDESNLSPCEDHRESRMRLPSEDEDAEESSIDDICSAFSGMNLKGDVALDPTEAAICPRSRLIIARRRRTPEDPEYLRGFNPRAPNFLPMEPDPDAEKVDLRHQMMDERKNAEEWMIDYALRRAVTNLAPARKKKVELLVQAFETVLPHENIDKGDKKDLTPTRPTPMQACN